MSCYRAKECRFRVRQKNVDFIQDLCGGNQFNFQFIISLLSNITAVAQLHKCTSNKTCNNVLQNDVRRSDDDYRSGFTVQVGYSKSGNSEYNPSLLRREIDKPRPWTKSTCNNLTKHRTYHTLQITELKQNKDVLDKGVEKATMFVFFLLISRCLIGM